MRVAGAVADLLAAVRARHPLIHHLASFVTMQAVASATRALGALPVMAMARDDADAIAGQADAVVISLGTPTPDRIDAMLATGHRAAARGIPIVLDPVGAGATPLRTALAGRLLREVPVAVIRANRGEAAALLGYEGMVRGVETITVKRAAGSGEASAEESARTRADAGALAAALAGQYRCVAAVTGPNDYVAGAGRILEISNGHPWLAAASGTGCMATAVVGAFCAVGSDHALAAAAGLACFGVAAEVAARHARGPGTLIPAVFDALFLITPEAAQQAARVRDV
jgi:hydroxyethylthiazole kinase